jgi:hypothetical protein
MITSPKPNPDAVLKLWVIRTQLRNRGQGHDRKAERLRWHAALIRQRIYKLQPPPKLAAKDYVNP